MEDNQITDNDKEDDKQDRIELVQRAVEGDKEAFTNLYTLTYSEVYHIVKVFIHNEDTAQDIVQETYYKSLRKIKQLKELIDQILGELDEKQRMVVGMFYYEQMSVNEIAEALNCSVNTVKSRLNYARKKIGKEIAELEKK